MTNEIHLIRPLFAILSPMVSPLISLIFPASQRNFKRAVHVLGSFTAFAVVLSLLPDVLQGKVFDVETLPLVEGVSFRLTVDALGYYYGLIVSFIWLLATVYSLGYIEHRENRFFSFMALCNAFLLGCAFSQNMFTFFIFYELMTFAAYPLIIHEETESARKAGFKYLVYAIIAGAVLFFGIITHYFWSGKDLSIISGGVLSLGKAPAAVLTVVFFAYLLGFGVKAAIMPLHGWVPDAHPEAPSPASALLSGVILKAGAFGIIRVVLNVFGLQLFKELGLWVYLAGISSFTIVFASIFALTQDNLKRLLAYSSIGQVSYILLGLSLGTFSGVLGGLMQLAHHALMKTCLFLCAGNILHETGKKNISEMAGIGRTLPVTMVAFTVAALAMMGTPPSVGFISKWLLGVGALEAKKPFFIVILLISALLNALYFLPIIYTAFFRQNRGEESIEPLKGHKEGQITLIPIVILAALVILGGIMVSLPGFPYSLVNEALKAFFSVFGGLKSAH